MNRLEWERQTLSLSFLHRQAPYSNWSSAKENGSPEYHKRSQKGSPFTILSTVSSGLRDACVTTPHSIHTHVDQLLVEEVGQLKHESQVAAAAKVERQQRQQSLERQGLPLTGGCPRVV